MNLMEEMKKNSGVIINESDVSQFKTMEAESRLLGAFSNLLRELKFIKRDICNRGNGMRMGGPFSGPGLGRGRDDDDEKEADVEKLHEVAMDKLELVKKEIEEIFKGKVKERDDEDEDED